MQNRYDNILMLFRFSFSVGVAVFGPTEISIQHSRHFPFKCLFGRLPSHLEHGTSSRYCVAVPNELPQYRAALDPFTDPVRFGRKILSRSRHAEGRTGAVVVLEAIEQKNLRAAVPRRQTFRPHRASNRLDGSRSESGKPARHIGAIAFILGSEAFAERRLLIGNYENVKKEPDQRAVAEEMPVSE